MNVQEEEPWETKEEKAVSAQHPEEPWADKGAQSTTILARHPEDKGDGNKKPGIYARIANPSQ